MNFKTNNLNKKTINSANKYKHFTKKYMFTNKIKTLSSAFIYKKVISAGIIIAMHSGFVVIAFKNINSSAPQVHAAGCTNQSTEDDNFDLPSQPLVNDYNYVGTNFNGWTGKTNISNPDPAYVIAIQKVNASPTYLDGPNVAKSGDQYINLGYAGSLQKKFTLTSSGKLSASAYFAAVDMVGGNI